MSRDAESEVAEGEDREFVTALARGLTVLTVFDRDHAELTLSEVAKLAGLSPGTTRRCLITMGRLGYVGTFGKRFFLLPKVVTIGASYLDAARVDELILPYLRELVANTGESSTFGILDGQDVLHLGNYSAKRLIRMIAGVGTRFPAYATSNGRVLLADMPPNEIDAFLANATLKSYTDKTVTDPTKLRQILKKVKRDGYAKTVDELEYGLSSVAVPVRVDGVVVAAVNSSMFFQSEESAETAATRLEALRQTAESIAQAIRRLPALLHSLAPR